MFHTSDMLSTTSSILSSPYWQWVFGLFLSFILTIATTEDSSSAPTPTQTWIPATTPRTPAAPTLAPDPAQPYTLRLDQIHSMTAFFGNVSRIVLCVFGMLLYLRFLGDQQHRRLQLAPRRGLWQCRSRSVSQVHITAKSSARTPTSANDAECRKFPVRFRASRKGRIVLRDIRRSLQPRITKIRVSSNISKASSLPFNGILDDYLTELFSPTPGTDCNFVPFPFHQVKNRKLQKLCLSTPNNAKLFAFHAVLDQDLKEIFAKEPASRSVPPPEVRAKSNDQSPISKITSAEADVKPSKEKTPVVGSPEVENPQGLVDSPVTQNTVSTISFDGDDDNDDDELVDDDNGRALVDGIIDNLANPRAVALQANDLPDYKSDKAAPPLAADKQLVQPSAKPPSPRRLISPYERRTPDIAGRKEFCFPHDLKNQNREDMLVGQGMYAHLALDDSNGWTAAEFKDWLDNPTQKEARSRLYWQRTYRQLIRDQIRYVHLLGQGTFGDVWKATFGGFACAIKLMKPAPFDGDVYTPEQERSRQLANARHFLREGKITGRLNHPHIIRSAGAFIAPPDPTKTDIEIRMILPLYAKSLHGWMYQPGASGTPDRSYLTFKQLNHVGAELFDGLAYLHSQGILHLDLKPANVLVKVAQSHQDPRQAVIDIVIADLGCHVDMNDELARNRVLPYNTTGTQHYWAPELFMNRDNCYVDRSQDIWAAGATLIDAANVGNCGEDSSNDAERRLVYLLNAAESFWQASHFRAALSYDASRRPTATQVRDSFKAMSLLPEPWAKNLAAGPRHIVNLYD